MDKSLKALRVAGLTNMEAGQLIKRLITDLNSIAPDTLTDQPFNTYLLKLEEQSITYEKALAQVHANEATQKISLADSKRDKAKGAIDAGIKFYSLSDDAEEVEACRGLKIILKNFKDAATLNYEAETLAIDKLVGELEKPVNAIKIEKLNMGRYVTRIKNANQAFKTLFSSRIQGEAAAETYNMKSIRKETYQTYKEFCTYVLAMARALNTSPFITALDLINTARSYYADMLARRQSNKEEPKEETPQ